MASTTTEKQPKSAPGDPVPQLNLLVMATVDHRLSRGDLGILGRLIKRFKKSKGNAWATHELLAEQAHLSGRQVIRSLQRLAELGYVQVLSKGVRGRGSVYLPSFHLVLGDIGVTETTQNMGDIAVTPSVTFPDIEGTDSAKRGDSYVTPPHLRLAPTGAQTLSESPLESPTSAPPRAPGGAEVDAVGFERVWEAYGVRTKRAQAKATFAGLSDVTKILDEIVAAATRWHEHYEAQGTPARYRKQLHTWLKRECYLEDPPSWQVPASAKPARPEPTPSPEAEAAPQHCRIVSATVSDGDEGSVLSLTLQPVTGGAPIVRYMRHQTWEAAEVDALLSATGLKAGDDSDKLEGREVLVAGRWYLPAPANDNDGEAATAASA
nr:hypothetical protein [Devosia sp. A16]